MQLMDPYHYSVLMQILLGPDQSGDPINGQPMLDAAKNPIPNTAGGYVGRVKRQNNDSSTTFREVRPADQIIGGTAGQYATTLLHSTTAPVQICGNASVTAKAVPQGQGVFAFGWYTDADLGEAGNMQVYVNGNLRQEVSGPEVFMSPVHLEIMLTQLAFAAQGDTIAFECLANIAADNVGMVWPLAVLIAPSSQLGFDTGAH
jgi:hypothetical protein